MQFARLNHTVIHYQLIGAPAGKPVIVFANSLGTDFRIWRDVVVRLAGDFAIVTYDKRGHGLSELGDAPDTIETHAADLAALLDHLQVEIGCHLRPVDRRPDRPGALCRAAGSDPRAHPLRHRAQDRHRRDVERANRNPPEARASAASPTASWRNGSRRNSIGSAAAELAGYRTMLIRQSVAGYAAACAAIRDADFTGRRQAHRSSRLLVVVGDQDGSTPPALVQSFAELIPGARFEIIANAAHIPCVEQPEALVALDPDFLRTGDRRWLMPASRNAYRQGLATRRKVLGDAHVERAQAAATDFDRPFQDLITEAAWGHVWSRPELDQARALDRHDRAAGRTRP